MKSKKSLIGTLGIIVIIVIVAVVILLNHKNNSATRTVTAPPKTGCVAEQLTIGDSGACVSDVQTMVDYMQTGGLTECKFVGGKLLPINGMFDTNTKVQVQVVEQWENCYNKQEGSDTTISTSGIVTTTAWYELCTYAYHFPLQSGSTVSSYRTESLSAGKNANCAALF